jgi:hypothetical protein
MELHLSGFFSMIASVIKPWTAAIRMGRALLTPTAPGLLDRKDCPSVEMGCFFERIGPVACEPARMNLAHFRFNLAEQYREGLTDAHAIPADFRHLGSFWWVSQLTQRLLRPRRQLRTMLRLACERDALKALFLDRVRLYDDPLVQLSIKTLTMHPPGTLVRLANGECRGGTFFQCGFNHVGMRGRLALSAAVKIKNRAPDFLQFFFSNTVNALFPRGFTVGRKRTFRHKAYSYLHAEYHRDHHARTKRDLLVAAQEELAGEGERDETD